MPQWPLGTADVKQLAEHLLALSAEEALELAAFLVEHFAEELKEELTNECPPAF